MDEIDLCVSSPPDRTFHVVELFAGDEQWAEIAQEQGDLTIEIYPHRNGETWSFRYDDLMEALQRARAALLGDETESAP